jgi:hypothetical protein
MSWMCWIRSHAPILGNELSQIRNLTLNKLCGVNPGSPGWYILYWQFYVWLQPLSLLMCSIWQRSKLTFNSGFSCTRSSQTAAITQHWHCFKMHFLHSQSTEARQNSSGMSLFRTATGLAMLIHCDLLWIFEGWLFVLRTGKILPRSEYTSLKVLKDQPRSLYCRYDIEAWTFFYSITWQNVRSLPLNASTRGLLD